MANILGSIATGNFTSASTWGVCSTVALAILDSEAGSTALTVATQDSATFVPAATAIDAVYLKLASRATGSPSNTMTVVLRNSTTATNALSITVNVSDLDPCDTTNKDGGWYCFKFNGSTVTPNGTDSYLIRVNVSATTTAVSLWTNGTGANWSRYVRTTGTAAPAAGDRMLITRELTAAGVGTNRTVTMDNTAATTFGNTTNLSTTRGNFVWAAIAIGKGGTLTWGTTASTNYFLSLTGHIIVYSGGTYTMGSNGAEIPRNSSAIVEFVMTSSLDSRVGVTGGATWDTEGLSRTAANNTYYALLNADAAAAATSLVCDRITGWLNTDEIAIAATTRTPTQSEERILNANDTTGTLSISAGLTNAHGGSNAVVAEVALITRNVQFRSNNSARFTDFEILANSPSTACSVTMRWTSWRYIAGAAGAGISAGAGGSYGTSSVFDVQFCSFRDYGASGNNAINFPTTGGGSTMTFNSNLVVGVGSGAGPAIVMAATTNTVWQISNNICIVPNGSGIQFNDSGGAVGSGNRIVAGSAPFNISESNVSITPGLIDNTVVHSGGGTISFGADAFNQTINGVTVWRQGSSGINCSNAARMLNVTFLNCVFFGNTTTNVIMVALFAGVFDTCTIAGDTSFSTANGLTISSPNNGMVEYEIRNCTFGAGGGTKTTHSTVDLNLASVGATVAHVTLVNTTLSSATKTSTTGTIIPGSFIAQQQISGTVAHSKQYFGIGTDAYETGTTHTSGFSEKLTPAITLANSTLRSSPKRVAVASGATVTMSVYCQKDGSYNGATAPRLLLLANPAIGITSDVQIGIMTGGASAWENVNGTTAAASAAGVMEFVVEGVGTAGNFFVAEWTPT
jgi:hypothetical protein